VLETCGKTKDQMDRITIASLTGVAVAKVVQMLAPHDWLWGGHGPATKHLPEPFPLFPEPDPMLPAALVPAVSFAQAGTQAVAAARGLIPAAQALKGLFDTIEEERDSLIHWKSERQMFAAFALRAAESEGVGLGNKELEAIALIAGFRPKAEEFEKDEKTTLERSENWRRSLDKARIHIVPALRKMSEKTEKCADSSPSIDVKEGAGGSAASAGVSPEGEQQESPEPKGT
jgi:hypothetical protein